MELVWDVVPIVVGLALIAFSRTIADSFRIPGNRSTFVKLGGLADDYVSQLMRWLTCVVAGVIFVGAGVAELLTR